MSRPVWRSTPQDPRRLTMLPHEIARQPVGERHRIHGPIQPMARERAGGLTGLDTVALLIAFATLGYFAGALIFWSA